MSLLDEYGIERDERFKRVRKEVKIIFGYMFVLGAYFIGISYWGSTIPVDQYNYIMGMPTYLFLLVVGSFLFMLIGCIIGFYVIEDASLEETRETTEKGVK